MDILSGILSVGVLLVIWHVVHLSSEWREHVESEGEEA